MPDRLPPSWGHEPEDGRDLDALLSVEETLSVEEMLTDEALLSGQLAGLSERQRPVAGAMFALRAAPAGSELAGEAAARAAFRALVVPAVRLPASAVPAGILPAGAAWSLGDSGGAELQHTLVLPVPAAGQGPRPPARHRHTAARRGPPGLAGHGAARLRRGGSGRRRRRDRRHLLRLRRTSGPVRRPECGADVPAGERQCLGDAACARPRACHQGSDLKRDPEGLRRARCDRGFRSGVDARRRTRSAASISSSSSTTRPGAVRTSRRSSSS